VWANDAPEKVGNRSIVHLRAFPSDEDMTRTLGLELCLTRGRRQPVKIAGRETTIDDNDPSASTFDIRHSTSVAAPEALTQQLSNSLPMRGATVHTGGVATTTLFRPVGQPELDLIAASDWRRFPPRLDWQPIFYPVTNEPYATRIARDWNTKDAENGNVGYVLRFEVDSTYLAQFDVQQVGDDECLEYWIPAEELDTFNDQIVGAIEVVSEWRAQL